MDGPNFLSSGRDDLLDPPPRLYERLRQIAGYDWDETKLPFHSTYGFWHVSGKRRTSHRSLISTSPQHLSSPGSVTRTLSSGPSPGENHTPLDYAPSTSQDQNQHSSRHPSTDPSVSTPPASDTTNPIEEFVVARVSYHGLREERAFQITKAFTATGDSDNEHFVKPINLIRLAPAPGDRGVITVAIYEHPGENYLWDVLDMGPAFYKARREGNSYHTYRTSHFNLKAPISLDQFLNFAIGAAQCLEMLHHGQGIVHGEIRGDAFYFNLQENKVRVASFGSGIRSFEHGLTSTGWTTLNKELGSKNKLLYISPEQTGRMPAEPDSRTDIYSVGVLFWQLLTQKQVFEGETPIDIVQAVLGRRVPNVAEIRNDIPDVVGRIIQKCTAKIVTERYHSASGLKHDLVKVQEFLSEGNSTALNEWKIGGKDISSFFMLPNVMIGRQTERNDLLKVIDRVAKTHPATRKSPMSRFSDGSALSVDVPGMDDLSSSGASSMEGANRRSGSFTHNISSDPKAQRTNPNFHQSQQSLLSDNVTVSGDTMSSTQSVAPARPTRPWERQQSISMDTRSLVDSLDTNNNRQSMADSGTSLSRQLGSAKFRRRGHCEVVVIEGAGGLGKSCLVQSVLAEARRRGYCATAKFDTSRRTAFGPLLKLLSSLFKQVWGERDTSTPFHQGLKQYIRPVWPMLHKVLGLPEFLLGAPDASSVVARSISSSQGSASRGTVRSPEKQRGSISPERSPGPSSGKNPSIASQSSQDFLRAGASTKTMRLMNTFLDVLRVFTQHKFICFCLDDLHFADDESLELISQIMGARMKMAIVITHRPDELSNEKMQQILHPPESDEFPRASGGLKVTNISLSALSEEDIVQYVSATLSRTREEIMPLALVIQSKTAGNPFYIREMLSACHRKRCVWYDYRDSMWHFDLDRLFDQFKGEKDYDVLDTGFITRRLDELPLASRTMLAWAALLGNSFSFELICCLMSGEFEYDDESNGDCCSEKERRGYSHSEVVAGLQAALQAFIVVASETDDRFRFAHDRYVHAAADLEECSARRMHFIISQTLLKYPAHNSGQDNTALHICKAAEIIKRRVTYRRRFRTLLIDCAQSSTENGARPTAAKYYDTAISLLQQSPWSTGLDDADYNETIQLYLRSAECYLFMGQHQPAHDLLTIIFQNAKTAIDKAPAFVLQSRIFSQNGNAQAAVVSLKECLGALGVELEENPTYQSCDERFHRLRKQIQSMDRAALLSIDQGADPTLASIGAVLSETASAAWWSDCLRYYHLTLVILETHLHKGAFPQSGVAFLHLAVVTLARHNMTEFAVELGSVSQELLHSAKDSFSIARGLMLYPCLIGHTHNPMLASLNQMEDAVEIASSAGDRTSTILSYGLHALIKFFTSENLTDLEAYCQYGCEEIPNWYHDTRGGAMLLAVRQVCRALSGKTRTREPQDVLSDELHNAPSYKNWLLGRTQHSNRSTLLYESLELVPLFLYGHYERAVEIGKQCVDNLPMLWSARNSRLILLIYGLSRTGQLLQKMQDPRNTAEDYQPQVDHVVRELKSFAQMTKDWATVSSVNYFIWYKLLEAQAAELTTDHGDCVEAYEEALDHAAEYNFVFEEALGNYLMAGFFLRRKARRSARAALMEALGLFRQFAATGVAMHIEEEHSLLLHGPTRNHRTAEAGVQTDFVSDAAPDPYRAGETDDVLSPGRINNLAELKGERTAAWGRSMNIQTEASEGLPTLDMIDLHAILHSSQVISSVLQIDDLLKKMCNVVLQTCGSSASLAAIVVHKSDENGLPQDDQWCVAASGDPEQGAQSHPDGLPISGDDLVVENVILFSTRFMESIFVSDLSSDERFSNVNDKWLRRNPLGRAVIAIPIVHGKDRDGKPALHGVLYLEGEPGSFTDRNVSVLQLLVMQLGISYSNAMAMGNINRVSVENEKMLRHQMELTGKAKTAEAAARHAEAEARKNVKLAEEAAKAKSIFLANVSHELRTPLNGVIGNSELLRDSQLNKEQLEMADSIRVSADLLLTVINDILDFSKMEADKMTLWMIAFNPEEMVREVVRAVSYSNREKTSKKNVKIIQNIDLPPMLIYGDPIRLHQVLGNLIGNSLKFTEDGSITIGARLESDTHEKATLTFWVRDTGIGIPPQQLRKLFQPFSQADASTARKYGGSGLGLSICKSLIEMMMKGHIKLESDEGKGTTASFTVAFDKTQPDVSAGEAQSKPPTSAEQRQAISEVTEEDSAPNPYLDLSGLSKSDVRICVAEDNPINQKIAIQYTQRLGYTNISAYDNGQKAVEGLRQKAKDGQPYHIILMDVQMPVLDGYEATKLLRKDPIEAVRKVLVIAMTASAIQGDREKCLAAGMNDYLAKPVRSEVLKRKLDTYLNAQHSDGIESSKPAHDASTKQSDDGSTSVQVVQPPKPPAANQQPPQMTVEDPMRDGAVFNQPLDDQSLSAKEEPIMETTSSDSSTPTPASKDLPLRNASSTSLALSRTSTSSDSKTGLTTDNTMGQGPQKRQQRKLTKSRGDSETNLDKLNKDRPRPSINSDETLVDKTERPKGVLVKKDRHTKISTASVVDGDGPENKPPVGKEDTANVNGSAPTQSSSSEDGLFPN